VLWVGFLAGGIRARRGVGVAGRALRVWIAAHPDETAAGGVRMLDRKAVVVYWKGNVPTGLQNLAAAQPVPVTFQPAP
jgi:hypothetical protein